MAREGFRKNPNNVSSILWYWATIIIHGRDPQFQHRRGEEKR